MFSFEVVHVHERQLLSHARNGNELFKKLQCWLLLEVQLAGKYG